MVSRHLVSLITILTIFAITFCAPLPVMGKGVSSIGGTRIGYVDFDRALNMVSDGRLAKKQLKDEFREKQKELGNLQNRLSKMKADIERDRATLPPNVIKVREEKYRSKFFELQQMLASFRAEMQSRETLLTQEILKRLKSIVNKIGRREGYSIILEKSQDIVLYAPTNEDLTGKVIKTYDSSSKGKGR